MDYFTGILPQNMKLPFPYLFYKVMSHSYLKLPKVITIPEVALPVKLYASRSCDINIFYTVSQLIYDSINYIHFIVSRVFPKRCGDRGCTGCDLWPLINTRRGTSIISALIPDVWNIPSIC